MSFADSTGGGGGYTYDKPAGPPAPAPAPWWQTTPVVKDIYWNLQPWIGNPPPPLPGDSLADKSQYIGQPGSPYAGPPAPTYPWYKQVGDIVKGAGDQLPPLPNIPNPLPGVKNAVGSTLDMNLLIKVGLGMFLLLFIRKLMD